MAVTVSRSVRRRRQRRRTEVPARSVVISLADANGNAWQSFSIMTGDTLHVTLTSYIEGDPQGRRIVTTPVTIKAQIA